MTETETPIPEKSKTRGWEWVLPFFFHPRVTYTKINARGGGIWQVPILIIILASLLEVFVAGSIRKSAAASGEIPLPPGYEYYTPEQQAQYMQAMSATSNSSFLYGLPAIAAVGKVLAAWLIIGGLLHLVITLLGGRGDTGIAMNIVAWAGLPFAVRSIVRAAVIYFSHSLIDSPGLSGFVNLDGGIGTLFLSAFLSLIDIYLIWNAILLMIGVRVTTHLSFPKVIGGVLLTLIVVITIQVLINFGIAKLGGLTIIRPFY